MSDPGVDISLRPNGKVNVTVTVTQSNMRISTTYVMEHVP